MHTATCSVGSVVRIHTFIHSIPSCATLIEFLIRYIPNSEVIYIVETLMFICQNWQHFLAGFSISDLCSSKFTVNCVN